MLKLKYFPVIYGVASSLIAFIACMAIGIKTFRLSLPLAVLLSAALAIVFYFVSYFRGHASYEIKRITAKFKLSDQELARLTGLKASDFPIYQNKLQLIIPKRQWPHVLEVLQRYEKAHQA